MTDLIGIAAQPELDIRIAGPDGASASGIYTLGFEQPFERSGSCAWNAVYFLASNDIFYTLISARATATFVGDAIVAITKIGYSAEGAFTQAQSIFSDFISNSAAFTITNIVSSKLLANTTLVYLLFPPFNGSVWDVAEIFNDPSALPFPLLSNKVVSIGPGG